MYTDISTIHHPAFASELTRLEDMADRIHTNDDLKTLLLRITALQRVVLDELKRRRMAEAQNPTA